jgi:hypothetical protein
VLQCLVFLSVGIQYGFKIIRVSTIPIWSINCLFLSRAVGSEADMGSPPLTLGTILALPGIQFPDDDGDVPRNAGSLAVPVPDAVASPMESNRRLWCSSTRPHLYVEDD